MIRFDCPKCGHPMLVKDMLGGTEVRCEGCGGNIGVPDLSIVAEPGKEGMTWIETTVYTPLFLLPACLSLLSLPALAARDGLVGIFVLFLVAASPNLLITAVLHFVYCSTHPKWVSELKGLSFRIVLLQGALYVLSFCLCGLSIPGWRR